MGILLKLAKSSIQIYEEQQSAARVLAYLGRYLSRRGPAALKRVFQTKPAAAPAPGANSSIPRVAIHLAGGVGDLIVSARFLRDLASHCGPLSFDLFTAQTAHARWIFQHVPGVDRYFNDTDFARTEPSYNLSLWISSFVRLKANRLPATEPAPNANLRRALDHLTQSNTEFKLLLDHHPSLDNLLAQKLEFRNVTRSISLHAMTGIPYGGDRLRLPASETASTRFNLHNASYVTVHNGFEVQNITSGGESTKCYPHFARVIQILRSEFPDIRFVQLGSKTSKPIQFIHHNLIGKTNLAEASTLVAGAICHLDNESGLVHIASCHATPSCVIFGPTPAGYFGYSSNTNLKPITCGSCWWVTNNWMDRCPRGLSEPVCTHTQNPAAVANAASLLIKKSIEKAA